MEREAYDFQARSADTHWWWEGRRRIIERAMERLGLAPDAKILEIGCGNGSNLPLLARFGSVSACDPDPSMVAIAEGRGLGPVLPGALPDALPYGKEAFDLIAMLDVLEHLEDDRGALEIVASMLSGNGKLLLTVPAYNWIWSDLDRIAEHKRRYTLGGLSKLCAQAGLTVEFASYFNSILLPVAVAVRLIWGNRQGGTQKIPGLRHPPSMLNSFLTQLLAAESHIFMRMPIPFGLSVLLVCRRTDDISRSGL